MAGTSSSSVLGKHAALRRFAQRSYSAAKLGMPKCSAILLVRAQAFPAMSLAS
jgi:hypothetical protein